MARSGGGEERCSGAEKKGLWRLKFLPQNLPHGFFVVCGLEGNEIVLEGNEKRGRS